MRIINFIEGDSYLHRMNPVFKAVSLFFVMLSVMLSDFWLYPLLIFFLAIILIFSAGVSFVAVRKLIKWLFIFMVAIVILNYLFYQPGGFKPQRVIVCSPEGLIRGLLIGLRIFAVVFLSAVFVFTTDPTDFVNAMMQNLHLSPRVGFSILVALRSIPLFELDLERIRAAHRVRQFKPAGGLMSRLKFSALSVALPLFVLAIIRAERAAIAMASRGLRRGIQRTYLRRWRVRLIDWIFFAVSVILLTLSIFVAIHF